MRATFACLVLLGALAAAKELRQAEREIVYVLKRVRPAVVTVITPNPRDGDMSGVVIASNGVILTLRSPLLGRDKKMPETVDVRVAGAKGIQSARVLDEDEATNTVLLIASSASNRAVKPGLVANTRVGEWALLVGNTFGAGRESTPSSSLGVVSGTVRANGEVVNLHISALVNPGSIGAPVFEGSGLLLGIVAPRITAAGGQTMVVPIDRVRAAYRKKRTPGRRAFPASNTPKRNARSLTADFGLVVEAAVARAKSSLVGVRSAPDADDRTPPPRPPSPKKKRRSRAPKEPARVPGKRDAWDRSSGLIVDPAGLILCPLRVTGWPKKQRRMVVDLLDGTSFKATILGTDERLRLALLQIERKDLPALRTAPRDTIRAGRFAIALGYPHENPSVGSPQVTVGILSRIGALSRVHPAMRALQTDAGISGGNRGGPLIDIDGNILGVILDVHETNTQGYRTKKAGAYAGNAGLGFAIPTRVLEEVVPRMKKGATLRGVLLGVNTRETKEGLVVVSVSAKNGAGQPTAAKAAGLLAGDIIVQLSGRDVRRSADLTAVLALRMVGDEVEIVWTRAGKRMSSRVALGPR